MHKSVTPWGKLRVYPNSIFWEENDDFYIRVYDKLGKRIEHWGYKTDKWEEFQEFENIVVQGEASEYITLWVQTTEHLYAIESNPTGLTTWTVK